MSPDKPLADDDPRNAQESKPPITATLECDRTMGTPGVGTKILGAVTLDDLERKATAEDGEITMKDDDDAHWPSTEMVDVRFQKNSVGRNHNVPVTGKSSIKVKLFNDDKEPTVDRTETQGNWCDETLNDRLGQELKTSETIWKQELLSSDYNLMYSSLRGVLMKNISKNDRHRLIQTMLATMGEIEEVTIGDGYPVPKSVRCESPEPTSQDEEEEYKQKPLVVKTEAINTNYSEFPHVPVSEGDFMRKELSVQNKLLLRERERTLNLKRILKLTKKNCDGTLMCVVCKNNVNSKSRICIACTAFTCRIQSRYTLGLPLPTCSHENYSGIPFCKSCRFRKFSFLDMTAKHTRLRNVKAKVCPICKKRSYFNRGWKCLKCHYFLLKLARKKEKIMPTCDHDGEFSDTCAACRCYTFQREWAKHDPERAYPLPLVEKK